MNGQINLDDICYTDECYILLDRLINRQNSGKWRIQGENIQDDDFVDERQVHAPAIMIFVALHPKIGIVTAEIMEGSITAQRYQDLLATKVIPSLKEKLNDDDFQKCWYQQDGASAHTARSTIDFLKREFDGRVISLNADFSPYKWPAHSPDMNPLDYWFWSALKFFIRRQTPKSKQELELIFYLAVTTFTQEQVKKAVSDLHWRLMACKEANGWHFEQSFKSFKRRHGALANCSFCNTAHLCDCGECDRNCAVEALARMFPEQVDLGAAILEEPDSEDEALSSND